MNIIFIIIGLILLVVGGEFLVRSAVALSFRLQLSKMVIGLTVVSMATSAPELLVSIQAALDGHSDISLGNVIGSNIANIGLVLGITALISPLLVDSEFFKLNWPVMAVASLLLFGFMTSDLTITRIEGGIFIIVLALYLFILIRRARDASKAMVTEEVDDALASVSVFKIIIWLLIGSVALYGGSELLVKGAVGLATALGISERIIAVTMIAIGTSVPELAASVIAALRKEKALSLGNLIGSNIFNILSVLGITAMIQPIPVGNPELLSIDIYWMLGFALLLSPLIIIPKRMEIGRLKGVLIFGSYAFFIAKLFLY